MTGLIERLEAASITCDSDDCGHAFYGILNNRGQFWTYLAFASEAKAEQYIRDFWRGSPKCRDECLRTHRIVPVRIQLTARGAS